MVKYTCNRCLKKFNKKYNYKIHINRKFKCEDVFHKMSPSSNTLEDHNIINDPKRSIHDPKMDQNMAFCKFCNKTFSNKSNLNKHHKRCKMKGKLDVLNNLVNKMDTFINGRKGLILEGMSDYVPIYDAYWKNVNKTTLGKLSPIQQVIHLANNPYGNYISLTDDCQLFSRDNK